MKLLKKLINYIKEQFRRKDGKKHSYQLQKNTYVTYANKQPKVKLRVHLAKLATNFNDLNYKGFHVNRTILIEEFEFNGLPGVAKLADKEVGKYVKSMKQKK